MIYVSIADLIPGLHHRSELSDDQQTLLVAAGIATVWIVSVFAHLFADVWRDIGRGLVAVRG